VPIEGRDSFQLLSTVSEARQSSLALGSAGGFP